MVHENFGCSLHPWPAAYWKAVSECISPLQARTSAWLSPGSHLKHFPPHHQYQMLKRDKRQSIQENLFLLLGTSNQFPEKNDLVSRQFTKFPWRFCCLILSQKKKKYQYSTTLMRQSFPPWYFFYPMKPATAPPPLRSLPLTLLCWQRFLLALSYYLVQDCVDCIHYPLLCLSAYSPIQ